MNMMRAQVFATSKALSAFFDALEVKARTLLTTPQIYHIQNIIITGSGDSLFAAQSVKTAIETYSNCLVSVKTPLEVARYCTSSLPEHQKNRTMLICISNSGEAARVVEAAQAWRGQLSLVVALSKNPGSRLALSCDKTLSIDIGQLPPAPGFAGYQVSAYALLLLAVRLGEVTLHHTMDRAQSIRANLKTMIATLADIVGRVDPIAEQLAVKLQKSELIEFVGPNLGLVDYGVAKILEASGRHALARDLEEWMHLNYFDAKPDRITTVLVVPANSKSASRAQEVDFFMRKLGRQIIRVGASYADTGDTGEHSPLGAQARIAEPDFLLEPLLDELCSALYLSPVLALLAAHLAERDSAEYGRGAKGVWEDCQDAATVQRSKIETSL